MGRFKTVTSRAFERRVACLAEITRSRDGLALTPPPPSQWKVAGYPAPTNAWLTYTDKLYSLASHDVLILEVFLATYAYCNNDGILTCLSSLKSK